MAKNKIKIGRISSLGWSWWLLTDRLSSLLITVFVLQSVSCSSDLNLTSYLIPEGTNSSGSLVPLNISGLVGKVNNERDSRQLFSILKNLLKPHLQQENYHRPPPQYAQASEQGYYGSYNRYGSYPVAEDKIYNVGAVPDSGLGGGVAYPDLDIQNNVQGGGGFSPSQGVSPSQLLLQDEQLQQQHRLELQQQQAQVQQQFQQQQLHQQQQYTPQGQRYPPPPTPQGQQYPPPPQNKQYPPPPPGQQYPMMNYPLNQHASVPYYQDHIQSQQQYLPQVAPQQQKPPGGGVGLGGLGSVISQFLTSTGLLRGDQIPANLITKESVGSVGAGSGGSGNLITKLGSNLLGIPEELDIASLVNFGAFEGMLSKVNQFDKLQCIPRMICQMVSKRNEDAKLKASTSTTTTERTTTTTTTERSSKKKKTRAESGRFVKIDGLDTALDQFVKFLELMQLKDWSLYPYVKGMYEGNQVARSSDCAGRFQSCPFAEDQLVYYFNNYNGGFFSSFRSSRDFKLESLLNLYNSTLSKEEITATSGKELTQNDKPRLD